MSKVKPKFYVANVSGSYLVRGFGDIPKTGILVKKKEDQELLDNHPMNGHARGFQAVERKEGEKTLNADGTVLEKENSTTKTEQKKQSEPEKKASESSGGELTPEDVSNAQQAKKFIQDNFGDDVDGRTLTTAKAIREVAEGLNPPVVFPNWN
jgi:hypothetical protein